MTYVLFGVSVGASLFATHEIHDCRLRNDLPHCPDGGYGEFRAREELRGGVSLTMASLSVYGREHWTNGWRDELINDSPAILWAGYNVKVGWSDHQVPNYPRMDETRFRVKY